MGRGAGGAIALAFSALCRAAAVKRRKPFSGSQPQRVCQSPLRLERRCCCSQNGYLSS
eukprot:COSAG01_NODE_45894_length_405_cov_0.830065_1_plen_57_part_01